MSVLSAAFCAVMLAGPARAVVLDWDQVSWTAGALTQTYDVDGDSISDIRITISGDTGKFASGFPVDDTGLTGGISPAEDALRLRVDFNNKNQDITVRVEFLNNSAGFTDVSFTMFDIDVGDPVGSDRTFVDQISGISALGTNGSSVAATITGGSATTVSGSGTLGATVTGNAPVAANSSSGNATISFGTNIISEFTFTYGQGPGSLNNADVQNISIYDLSFKKIPEYHPGLAGILMCGALIALQRLRRLSFFA